MILRVIGRWKIERISKDGVDSKQLSDSCLATSMNSTNLVIKADMLEQGAVYQMTLKAKYVGQIRSSEAILRKEVSVIPFGGNCEVWYVCKKNQVFWLYYLINNLLEYL